MAPDGDWKVNGARGSGSDTTPTRALQNKEKHPLAHGVLYAQHLNRKDEDSKTSDYHLVIHEE